MTRLQDFWRQEGIINPTSSSDAPSTYMGPGQINKSSNGGESIISTKSVLWAAGALLVAGALLTDTGNQIASEVPVVGNFIGPGNTVDTTAEIPSTTPPYEPVKDVATWVIDETPTSFKAGGVVKNKQGKVTTVKTIGVKVDIVFPDPDKFAKIAAKGDNPQAVTPGQYVKSLSNYKNPAYQAVLRKACMQDMILVSERTVKRAKKIKLPGEAATWLAAGESAYKLSKGGPNDPGRPDVYLYYAAPKIDAKTGKPVLDAKSGKPIINNEALHC